MSLFEGSVPVEDYRKMLGVVSVRGYLCSQTRILAKIPEKVASSSFTSLQGWYSFIQNFKNIPPPEVPQVFTVVKFSLKSFLGLPLNFVYTVHAHRSTSFIFQFFFLFIYLDALFTFFKTLQSFAREWFKEGFSIQSIIQIARQVLREIASIHS